MIEQHSGSRQVASLSQRERLLRYFEEMLVVRLFEERVLELRRSEEVQGSVHLCIGQEAVPVGACAALNVDDPVYATYRGHGWALACGAPLEAMFAEVLGRESGVNAGRGGSAYLSCSSAAFMGENSIVGGGVPIAVGSALASRFRKDGKVAVTVFGDGATNQGSVHEAMNMAAAFSLAVIFVCENNVYSELTPIADMVAEADLSKRAAAYGMRSLRVDGNDPDAVAAAVGEAAEEARAGAGPTFVEALTYRLCGHYIGDAETYRTPEEVDEARIREPLVAIIDALGAAGVEPSSIDECRDNAHRRVEVAADTALTTPFAPTNTVREHLYA